MQAVQNQQQRAREAERNTNLIKDGDDEDDGAMQQDDGDDDDRRPSGFNMGADDGQSKVVQEARKLMQDEDDNGGKVQADTEDAGQGIRMGKLGRKKKKRGAVAGKAGE